MKRYQDGATPPAAAPNIDEPRLVNRIALRLLPLLALLYLFAYVDRSNIGFAKLQMLDSLHISEAAYALGASCFFVGYLLFEVPSNLMLHRFGAGRWIARIAFTWGLVTILLAFTQNATQFYVLRFLLGAAEAGLYPGVVYYLSNWFPSQQRVRVLGYFTIGSSLGNMIGAPICGWLLDQGGLFGLAGWQLVFIVTGLPPVLLTALVLRYLPDGPASARFLSATEKTWLSDVLKAERDSTAKTQPAHAPLLKTLVDPRVLGLAGIFMLITISSYSLSYWLPTLVKSFGVGNTQNGLLNIVPYLLSTLVLLWLPGHLRAGNRSLYGMFFAALIGLGCFTASAVLDNHVLRFAMLCLGAPCIYTLLPCMWTLPGRYFTGARAAVGIAAVSSLGNFGGFFGQNLMPLVRQATGSEHAPMLVPAACMLCLALITAGLIRQRRRGERLNAGTGSNSGAQPVAP